MRLVCILRCSFILTDMYIQTEIYDSVCFVLFYAICRLIFIKSYDFLIDNVYRVSQSNGINSISPYFTHQLIKCRKTTLFFHHGGQLFLCKGHVTSTRDVINISTEFYMTSDIPLERVFEEQEFWQLSEQITLHTVNVLNIFLEHPGNMANQKFCGKKRYLLGFNG